MLSQSNIITVSILMFLCVFLLFLLIFVARKKRKRQLDKIFIITFSLLIFWMLCLSLQIIFTNIYNVNPLIFEYFSYISVCLLPVSFLFLALIFAKTKVRFRKIYLLPFVIPAISLLLLWTNNWHHLFYEVYSTESTSTVFGKYFYIHYYYTLLLYIISLYIFIKYSIKNSGLFSRQAILIVVGALVPVVTNLLGYFGVLSSIYITPITLAITIICASFAIFK